MVALYGVSGEGRLWLDGYDLRQMVGQPGWFGSFGSQRWAGVGQAIPHSVLHEVSHSYFGAFPVSGRPDLKWGSDDGSSAIDQYRADLETFMFQPPDHYEPLRERFRNLPNLSRGEYPDLYHAGEADLMYTTGGNLGLIPPILRKYFDRFLEGGRFEGWPEAIEWYMGLPQDDRRFADEYIGVTHIPRKGYGALDSEDAGSVPADIVELVQGEERQRLRDFAGQFDLVLSNEFSFVGAVNVDRSFQFWRDYLREMLTIHRRFPGVLASAPGRGLELKAALDLFIEAEELPEEDQAGYFRDRLRDPFVMNFSVLIPTRALLNLFGGPSEDIPLDSVQGVVGSFARRLAQYARRVDDVLTTGRDDPADGASRLEEFLGSLTDERQEKDLVVLFDMMQDADRATTLDLLDRLSDDTILRMLHNKPSAVRSSAVSSERLLRALGVTTGDEPDRIAEGLRTLMDESSGNFEIDAPSSRAAYAVILDLGVRDSGIALSLLHDARVPLLDFVEAFPREASELLSSDIVAATGLVSIPRGFSRSPQGTVHGLIHVDPDLAARIVSEMDRRGQNEDVVESVMVFAYDADRMRAYPGLGLSVEHDAQYLARLLADRGGDWLEARMAEGAALYRERVEQQDVPPDFIEAYRRTLAAAASSLDEGNIRSILEEVVSRVFG